MSEETENQPEHQADSEARSPAIFIREEDGRLIPVEYDADAEVQGPLTISVSRTMARSHQGPLPDRETLAGYEQFYPGCGRLLIEEHLQDSQHMREMQRQVVAAERSGVLRGQVFSFLLMGAAIGGAVSCAFYDHVAVGVALASGPALTALGRFLGKASDAKSEASPSE